MYTKTATVSNDIRRIRFLKSLLPCLHHIYKCDFVNLKNNIFQYISYFTSLPSSGPFFNAFFHRVRNPTDFISSLLPKYRYAFAPLQRCFKNRRTLSSVIAYPALIQAAFHRGIANDCASFKVFNILKTFLQREILFPPGSTSHRRAPIRLPVCPYRFRRSILSEAREFFHRPLP